MKVTDLLNISQNKQKIIIQCMWTRKGNSIFRVIKKLWLLAGYCCLKVHNQRKKQRGYFPPHSEVNSFIPACIKLKVSHLLSGSTIHSPSHSQPFGGRKYSLFSLIFPVTSENLWRPTSPEVPHFPKRRAWFSYCLRRKNKTVL